MPDMRRKIEEYIKDTLTPEIKRLEDDINDPDSIGHWYERAVYTVSRHKALSEVKNDLKMLLEELTD